MVDSDARAEIEGASDSPSATCTLLVELATDDAASTPSGSRRERLAALRSRREPLQAAWLQEFHNRGARAEPLTVGAALVISAPLALWREWVRPGGWLATEQSLRVRPAGRFETLT
jgi:hypothetical protein